MAIFSPESRCTASLTSANEPWPSVRRISYFCLGLGLGVCCKAGSAVFSVSLPPSIPDFLRILACTVREPLLFKLFGPLSKRGLGFGVWGLGFGVWGLGFGR